jgi:hypothetical protein
VTNTRPFPLRARTAAEPERDLTPIVVIYRAMLRDVERLADSLGGPAGGVPPAWAAEVRRYATALLAAIRADHDGKGEVLWPVVAALAGRVL